MVRGRRRKCRHCGKLYSPDPRNRWHQRYCSEPACQAASKAASQGRWSRSRRGRGYFRGRANVLRVQAWRKAHPGYWRRVRKRAGKAVALQDDCRPEPLGAQGDKSNLNADALQDVLSTQDPLLLGLVANLAGSALQDDIDLTARRLIGLGLDIQGRGGWNKGRSRGGNQASAVPGAVAAGAAGVQLDRPPLRPG